VTDAEDARLAVHRTCLRMADERLVVGSAGNVSVRFAPGGAVVSAGGVDYDHLASDDHPVVDLASGRADGPRPPTSELPLHLGLLRAMPEVLAIVHTHSRYAAAFSVVRQDLPFIINENLGPASERILVTRDYAPPGSAGLAEQAVAAFALQPGSRAILLANHWVVALGRTAEQALLVAAQVEWIAEVLWLARAVGTPRVLSRDQQDAVAAAYGVRLARPGTP
jgi:L-fuculose-phosphate aldolase